MLNPSCKLKSASIFSNAYFCQYQLTCKCNVKKKVNVISLPAEHQGTKLVQKCQCIPGSNLNLEMIEVTRKDTKTALCPLLGYLNFLSSFVLPGYEVLK